MRVRQLSTKWYPPSSVVARYRYQTQTGRSARGVSPPRRNRAASTWCRRLSLYHGLRPEYKTRFHRQGDAVSAAVAAAGHCPQQWGRSEQLSAHIVGGLQIVLWTRSVSESVQQRRERTNKRRIRRMKMSEGGEERGRGSKWWWWRKSSTTTLNEQKFIYDGRITWHLNTFLSSLSPSMTSCWAGWWPGFKLDFTATSETFTRAFQFLLKAGLSSWKVHKE